MRKGHDGEKNGKKKRGKKGKRLMNIVATTSLPAVDRPNADRWNAARSCQKYFSQRRKLSELNIFLVCSQMRFNGQID